MGDLDTFVLDFVNNAEDIAKAFAPFYGRTWSQPTDPNILSNLKTRLLDSGVRDNDEVDDLVAAFLTNTATTNEVLYAQTDPAIGRWLALNEEEQEQFRTALRDYVRLTRSWPISFRSSPPTWNGSASTARSSPPACPAPKTTTPPT